MTASSRDATPEDLRGSSADGIAGHGSEAATSSAAAPLREQLPGLLACVHCGFCLNACPTFDRLGHEGDSPRGRLDLMRAVAEGRLPADDPSFHRHIDQCLGCRACEPVCPSGVPYGFLLEHARATMARAAGVPWTTRLLIASFSGQGRGVAGMLSRLLRASGLPRMLARAPLPDGIRFAMAMLAASAPPGSLPAGSSAGSGSSPSTHGRHTTESAAVRGAAPGVPPGAAAAPVDDTVQAPRPLADPHSLAGGHPPARGDHERGATAALDAASAGPPAAVPAGPPAAVPAGPSEFVPARGAAAGPVTVAMLDGCVQEALFGRVNRATRDVLTGWGAELRAVPGQVCCGALDAHAGRLEQARAFARRNIAAFEASGAKFIIVNAAGCGAMMKEYPHHLADDPEWSARARAFSDRVRDLNEFLATMPPPPLAPVPLRVTYDAPCHLLHAQRIAGVSERLLDAVPGLERVPLRRAEECCGGAGLYGVNHPELGGQVLADKLDAIAETGAAAVVTPNPGCMMQIGAGLLLRGSDVQVLHPVELLARACAPDGTHRGGQAT